ncbi:MAG: hypothetical protein ACFBWO_16340 [Paracoccaceae bacterium]
MPVVAAFVVPLLTYAGLLVLAYGAGVGFVMLFVPSPTLVDIVSACKIVSLFVLIYSNRETPESIDIGRHRDISAANLLIVLMSIGVLLLMVVKTVVDDYAMMTLAPAGRAVLMWFDANGHWVSTLPLFGYFALDLYIAFGGAHDPRDRAAAREFVAFRDLVCAAPLALVLILTEAYAALSPLAEARDDAAFFFGGALAVILLSSAIASKALNLSQEARRGPARHDRAVPTMERVERLGPGEGVTDVH